MTTLSTISGTNYRKFDGSTGEGSVLITTNIAGGDLRDPVGDVIWSGFLEVPIVDGTWSATVPPTDDPTLSAQGFVYIITERLKHKDRKQWRTVTTSAPAGVMVNMADLASGVVVPPPFPEQGVARSDFLAFRNEVEQSLPGQVTDAVGEALDDLDPDLFATPAAAAVDDAVAGLSLVKTTDPGAPVTRGVEVNGVVYQEVTYDAADRMSEGTMSDGTRHVPRLRVERVTDLRSTTNPGGAIEVGGVTYDYVELDQADRVAYGERADGGRFIGRLRTGRMECHWTGKKAVVLGTSITEGFNAPVVGGVRMGFVVKALRDDIGMVLDNQGVASSGIVWDGTRALSLSATQAELTAAGFDPAQSYEVKVLGKNADLYLFDHAYNDRTKNIGSINDADPATFYGAYNRVIGALLAEKPTAQIAFITPPSLYTPAPAGLQAGTSAARLAVLALAEKYAAPVLDLSLRLQMSATQSIALASDGVHPDDPTHTRMSRQLAAFVRSI
jgi:hypothetical protein